MALSHYTEIPLLILTYIHYRTLILSHLKPQHPEIITVKITLFPFSKTYNYMYKFILIKLGLHGTYYHYHKL